MVACRWRICAAAATPWAWLPEENATTPPPRLSCGIEASLLKAPRNLNDPVRCSISGRLKNNPRGGLPGGGGGESDGSLPRNRQRLQAGRAQVVVQAADRRRADHLARTGARKGSNRQATGPRLQQHQDKRVGLAGK